MLFLLDSPIRKSLALNSQFITAMGNVCEIWCNRIVDLHCSEIHY